MLLLLGLNFDMRVSFSNCSAFLFFNIEANVGFVTDVVLEIGFGFRCEVPTFAVPWIEIIFDLSCLCGSVLCVVATSGFDVSEGFNLVSSCWSGWRELCVGLISLDCGPVLTMLEWIESDDVGAIDVRLDVNRLTGLLATFWVCNKHFRFITKIVKRWARKRKTERQRNNRQRKREKMKN